MANGDQITEDQVFVCTAVRIDIRKDGIKGDGIAVDVGECLPLRAGMPEIRRADPRLLTSVSTTRQAWRYWLV